VVGGAHGERARCAVAVVTASALYIGHVSHRRRRPREHAFRVSTYHVLIDVDELDVLEERLVLFGHRRRAVTRFDDRDHFGPVDRPVRDKVGDWLAAQGRRLPEGPLRVLTNLRVFGHVFNPVSWWFAHDRDGRLELVLAEVNNTFGESHVYVLDVGSDRGGDVVRAGADKVFHVSPFLPVTGLSYRFSVLPPGERVLVHMGVDDDEGRIFDATQDGRRVELDARSLRRALVRYPLVPLVTLLLIHGHALRLWLKRVPFHRKPIPPDDGFERATSSARSRRGGPRT